MKKILLFLTCLSVLLQAQIEKNCKKDSVLGEYCEEITFGFKDAKKDIFKIKKFVDGVLLEEINLLNGVKDGKTIRYNKYVQSKQVLQIINYKAGKKHGLMRSFHMNGKLKEEVSFRDDLPFGKYRLFHDNGNLVLESNYEDGKKHGLEIKYRLAPNIFVSKTTYKNGRKNGIEKLYYDEGVNILKSETNYKDSIKDGKYIYYNVDFKFDREKDQDIPVLKWIKYGDFKGGINHGEEIIKFANKQTKSKLNYKNGIYVGKFEEYYENGQKKLLGSFSKNGKRDGKWLEYYNNGNQKNIFDYKDGQITTQFRFSPDGTMIN